MCDVCVCVCGQFVAGYLKYLADNYHAKQIPSHSHTSGSIAETTARIRLKAGTSLSSRRRRVRRRSHIATAMLWSEGSPEVDGA